MFRFFSLFGSKKEESLLGTQATSGITGAELALLSQFKRPCLPIAYGVNGRWQSTLGENPESVINRFITRGLLVEAPVDISIGQMSAKDIQTHLKTLGLKVSGKKEELAKRLAEAATPEFFEKLRQQKKLWVISPTGLELLNPHIQQKESHRARTEESIRAALARGDLEAAVAVAVAFQEAWSLRAGSEREAMFPSVMPKQDLLKRLDLLRQAKSQPPACLRGLARDARQRLFDAFEWIFLLNENYDRAERIKSLDLGPCVEPVWAAHMLHGWVQGKIHLRQARESQELGLKIKIKILPGGDCPLAKRHQGILYEVNNVPELPAEGCQRKPCCACCYSATVK